jgi:hypothetical protein
MRTHKHTTPQHRKKVSGPQRDLHSGNDGGVFTEPMADLVQLLGSLHGPGGKILVPGFYNDVRPQLMQLAWQGLEDSEEFSMASYRRVCAGWLACALGLRRPDTCAPCRATLRAHQAPCASRCVVLRRRRRCRAHRTHTTPGLPSACRS